MAEMQGGQFEALRGCGSIYWMTLGWLWAKAMLGFNVSDLSLDKSYKYAMDSVFGPDSPRYGDWRRRWTYTTHLLLQRFYLRQPLQQLHDDKL